MTLKTIHIIHCVDIKNTGDMVSSCDNYYKFKDCKIVKHCIYKPDFKNIKINDVIILSGGGLLNCIGTWNKNINKLLNISKNVIGWGIGFNKSVRSKRKFDKIDFNRFKLLGIRDFFDKYPCDNMEYVPCSSCNLKQLRNTFKIKRHVGICEHHHLPIKINKFDKINNENNINQIINFIGSSEIVISNSYHCIYFSSLLNKKTILHSNWSEKFKNMKSKYLLFTNNINNDINSVKNNNEGLLDECILINNNFYKKVINVISNFHQTNDE